LKRITIKDIAKELKIHHSTVSRALRNENNVSAETKKRVNDFAREIGYQVNMNALQLRGSVKNMVAILVPNIHHNFFSNIVSTVADLAFKKGVVVSIFQSNENYLQEKEIIKTLIRNNVAGVIASISMETINSEHFRELEKYRIPLVLFDRVCHDLNVSKVMVNNFEVVASAVELLIKKGYRNIAHISGPKHINVFNDRQEGYMSAIKKNRLKYHKIVRINSAFTIDEGRSATENLFRENIKPDAIICDSHFLTLGAIFSIRELNLKIPEDIGIVGFGDNPYVKALNSEIIFIVQPETSIANTVFELILKKIEKFENEIAEIHTLSAMII
jgi:LacI family transcriptional regulator